MGKNIVICADGTGNSFAKSISNVARMVRLLALDDRDSQVAVYDQGIGTDARRWQEILKFRETICDTRSLHVLPGPHESWFPPAEFVALNWSLATGYGLRDNVRQMYGTLAKLYENGDAVFLFGFSRGAFTVRALAGLIYRCGLPRRGRADFTRLFERAWELFKRMHPLEAETKEFWAIEGQRECPIHFLGVWDTVKSYGGFYPKLLPHLRHNPIVTHVRHAVALDEQRGWFDVTTWGRLDSDRKPDAAWSRLSKDVRDRIEKHDIEEVWFRGCHSDVGGGTQEARSAQIALRWMLGEAARAGLRLNSVGLCLLQRSPEHEQAEVHPSDTLLWRLIELVPRATINNDGQWPKRVVAWRGAVRQPYERLRCGRMTVHESVGVKIAATKTLSSTRVTVDRALHFKRGCALRCLRGWVASAARWLAARRRVGGHGPDASERDGCAARLCRRDRR